jgi:putative methyltransferase (TIGR04325 family)
MGSAAPNIEAGAPLVIRAPLAEILGNDMPYKLGSEEDGFRIFMPDLSPRQNIWQGNYASWEQASAVSGNYENTEILKKTLETSRLARDGKIVCERDSVPLPQREYPLPTLSGVLLGAARNDGELHIIDFGGALGSTYRTCLPFLRQLKMVRWHVVELSPAVALGKKEFQNQELFFHSSIEECMRHYRVDGILFGATLQYLPDPYGMLQSLAAYNFDYLIIDRTSFSKNGGHRICVQNIPESIYKASYPCHILDLDTCLKILQQQYTIVDVTPSQEGTLGDINFEGIIATRGSLQTDISNTADLPSPARLFQEKMQEWGEDTSILRNINLGCGNRYLPDWLNIDFAAHPPFVLGWNLTNGIPLPDAFADAVYHSNLIEHFTPNDALAFLKECVRVLKPGGILRIAAPDLEGAVRSYLACLEGARSGEATWQARYDWAVIELIDQLVRHQSGGEMLRYWSMKDIPTEDYILERVGTEYISARKHILQQQPATVYNQKPRPLEVGRFRLGGEVHQWMYDTYSLKKLMAEAGVIDIAVCAYAESSI